MRRRFGRLIVGCLLAAGPASAQIAVTSSTLEQRLAAAGESYMGTIRVKNMTSQPQEARIYQTDYLFFADGRSFYDSPGTVPRSNAGWVSFSPSYLAIPAGEEATIAYTMSVPTARPESPLTGTYWSMLMVEAIAPSSPESSRASANGEPQFGVRPTIRYGVQLATHIADTGERKVEFAGTRARAERGADPVLEFDLVNTGERAFSPELWVELYDPAGRLAGEFRQRRGLIYPGTSVRQRFELGSLPPGSYKALVVADTGGEDVFGTQVSIRF